jgi:phage terminase large subunit-like protein
MTREVLDKCLVDFDPMIHHGKRIHIGLDLSQNRDLTAKANVVETGSVEVAVKIDGVETTVKKPTFDAWVEAWTPGDTLAARELRDKIPYSTWVLDGHLQAPKGATISYLHVAQSISEDDRDYEIGLVAYDRYAFRRFEEDARSIGLAVEYIEHPQGGTKKGKPTEVMKAAAKRAGVEAEGLWMPGSVKILEDAMLEGRIRIKRNPVVVSAMLSAVTENDRWGNHWLSKLRSINKIDPAVALAMAIGAAHANRAEKTPLRMFMVG